MAAGVIAEDCIAGDFERAAVANIAIAGPILAECKILRLPSAAGFKINGASEADHEANFNLRSEELAVGVGAKIALSTKTDLKVVEVGFRIAREVDASC